MEDVILKIENLSKQYRLGTIGTGTISHDLNRWWYKVRGKEDPFLKIGESNDRSTKGTSEYVWALKDINFEVKKGEVLGIIGKNGAGKSTLLKILSKVTGPTTGSIKSKGRIASLLEVGTGFHPEMTGRENVFLNGAILGMTKKEINYKIDEIIDFSGCQRYIDTPVKRYSSGMTVRLAFAVAAFLEPDILVIDEVLAVGDAEFQKKAIGKMQEISRAEGRTVLFVSHNMESVQKLCTRTIVLSNGKLIYDGNVSDGISYYLNINIKNPKIRFPLNIKNGQMLDFYMLNNEGKKTNEFLLGMKCSFVFILKNTSNNKIPFDVRLQFFDKNEMLLTTINTFHMVQTYQSEPHESFSFMCVVDKLPIVGGNYNLGLRISNPELKEMFYENQNFWKMEIIRGDFYNTGKIPNTENSGKFLTEYNWIAKSNFFV